MNIVERYRAPRYALDLEPKELVRLVKSDSDVKLNALYPVYRVKSCYHTELQCSLATKCPSNKIRVLLEQVLEIEDVAWSSCCSKIEDATGRPIVYER